MPKVLVTDASERAALAVIRSLGKRQIDVAAADCTHFNVGFLSKYCGRKFLYPSPELEKSNFVKAMLKLVKSDSFDLLIPISDLAMIPIIERRDDFEKYTKVAAPDYSTAIKALDKIETLRIAIQQQISCPETMFGEEVDNVQKLSKEITYPVVIRPRMKVSWIGDKAVILKVTSNNYAFNPGDFVSKWKKLVYILKKVGLRKDFLMISRFVQGEGYGVEVLLHDGAPKAVFLHRRLREYPATGGGSTLRESVKDNGLAELGIGMLRAMDWEGVAMVEFRVDAHTRRPELIEVNGRFWGSLPLAINSGVDFPYLLYKSMVDEEDFHHPSYQVGFKQRWLAGDILWLYSSLANGGRITSSIKEFLLSWNVPDDIMTLDDMNPVCGQILFVLNFLTQVAGGHRSLTGEVIP